MDAAAAAPVVWISAPAGAGKTTLVESYLSTRGKRHIWYQIDERDDDIATLFYFLGAAVSAEGRARPLPLLSAEYASNLTTFARIYFEQLFAALSVKSNDEPIRALVFDNYHQVAEGAAFHEVLKIALSAVPSGFSIFMISRSDPPAHLARLRTSGEIHVLDWDILRLNAEETRAFLDEQHAGKLSQASIDWIYARTRGWVAGVRLFGRSARGADVDHANVDQMTDRQVFDYFASELFDSADLQLRDLLLKTSFVSSVTPQLAERLTGDAEAGRMLARLFRNNFFMEERRRPELSYQYHPLFRDFLMARARAALPEEAIIDLKAASAVAAAKDGQIEDAADLLAEIGRSVQLSTLILEHARMLAIQGRHRTLAKWLGAVPPDLLARDPWLLFWSGVCRFVQNPHESRALFEGAFRIFRERDDRPGVLLTWAGIIESILFGWNDFAAVDSWIVTLDELLDEGFELEGETGARVTAAMLAALTLRRPHHPRMHEWVHRAMEVAHSTADVRIKSFLGVYLELYFLWVGDHAGAERINTQMTQWVSSADAPPLARLVAHVIGAVYYARLADHGRCMGLVEEGLEIAEQIGLHLWDSQLYSQAVNSSLSAGRVDEARIYLTKMRSAINDTRRVDACMYHYNAGWLAVVERDLPAATREAEAAMRAALEAGTPLHIAMCRIALAQVCHEHGDRELVQSHLRESQAIATAMRSRILDFMILLARAHFALSDGDDDGVGPVLGQALALGKAQGYVNFYWWRADVMTLLASYALERGIEVSFVRDLVRRRDLPVQPRHTFVENWPWTLKIRTFGALEIERDGRLIDVGNQSHKRPLELLRALLAHGGREVPSAVLMDALWPDSEGDQSQTSLDTTLHRLRRLLGDNRLLEVRDARVSLESKRCWVDAWAFVSMLDTARAAGTDRRRALLSSAVALYRGPFLGPDGDRRWAIPMQERLRSRFVRAVCLVGDEQEARGFDQEALLGYESAIDVYDLEAVFYERAMTVQLRLGRSSDALKTYARCREALRNRLHTEPPPQVAELYRRIPRK